MAYDYTPEEAMEEGRATAAENVEAERAKNPNLWDDPTPEIAEDARETARLNHEADVAGVRDGGSNELKNDTSKKAKQDTAKSQLDPSGEDPITKSEINASATNADMNSGSGTHVSNEENAERAKNPGKAEEEAPLSIANPDSEAGEPADEDAAHPGGGKADQSADKHAAKKKASKS